jgi:hypothetical protein
VWGCLLFIVAVLAAGLLIDLTGLDAAAVASVTAHRGCSRDDAGQIWPAEIRAGSKHTLVPAGAISLVVCGYNGMNATSSVPEFGLTGAGTSEDPATVGRITSELDAIKPTPANAVYSCPMQDGSQDIATFGYRAGPSVVVTLDTGACNISNRYVMRTGLGAPVVSRVMGLAKPAKLRWASVVGHITLCGGPAPSRCHTVGFNGDDTIVATNPEGRSVASARAHGGRFRLLIASAGPYEFSLQTSIHNLTRATNSPVKVTVNPRGTTLVVFHVAIP